MPPEERNWRMLRKLRGENVILTPSQMATLPAPVLREEHTFCCNFPNDTPCATFLQINWRKAPIGPAHYLIEVLTWPYLNLLEACSCLTFPAALAYIHTQIQRRHGSLDTP